VIDFIGAGEGNRTLVFSLEGCCSTIELHPRVPLISAQPSRLQPRLPGRHYAWRDLPDSARYGLFGASIGWSAVGDSAFEGSGFAGSAFGIAAVAASGAAPFLTASRRFDSFGRQR
jgi:hypothetical protein